MARSLDWGKYINHDGDFELAEYLFRCLNDLMKQALDMGTLLSSDPVKTRAYKEQIKRTFKDRWRLLAEALEYFEIIVRCSCDNNFCEICGGSRYILNSALSPDVLREIAVITSPADDPELERKLQEGLARAMQEVDRL